MMWDFAEGNRFEDGPCDISQMSRLDSQGRRWTSRQRIRRGRSKPTRQRERYDGLVVATDPPYYDNVGYADLSDFFYVWLRRSLGSYHIRTLLGTMLTPKTDELVADPFRHEGTPTSSSRMDSLRSSAASAKPVRRLPDHGLLCL